MTIVQPENNTDFVQQQLNNIDFFNWALTALAQGQTTDLAIALEVQHPSVVGKLLESVPAEQRPDVLALLPEQNVGSILYFLPAEIRNQLLQTLQLSEITNVAESLDPTALAGTLDSLPDAVSDSILSSLDADNLKRVNAVLEYAEGSAGRIMSTDVLSVKPDITVRTVLQWLRKQNSLPPYTSSLMVIDDNGTYLGKLPMSEIVTGNLDALVETVMQSSSDVIVATATEQDVARLFEQRQIVSVAVLDNNNQLIGRLTVDQAMDIQKRQSDKQLLGSRGLSGEADLFAPIEGRPTFM